MSHHAERHALKIPKRTQRPARNPFADLRLSKILNNFESWIVVDDKAPRLVGKRWCCRDGCSVAQMGSLVPRIRNAHRLQGKSAGRFRTLSYFVHSDELLSVHWFHELRINKAILVTRRPSNRMFFFACILCAMIFGLQLAPVLAMIRVRDTPSRWVPDRLRQQIRRVFALIFLCLTSVIAITGFAQSPKSSSDQVPKTTAATERILSSYEGQNVTAVQIAGRPDLMTAQFSSLLQQHAGESRFPRRNVDADDRSRIEGQGQSLRRCAWR